MILRLYNFESCRDTIIPSNGVLKVACQHSATFRNIVANLKAQEDYPKELAIINNNEALDLKKSCFVITDYFDFSLSNKAVINKLYTKIIEDNLAEVDTISAFQSIFAQIIKNIDNLISDVDVNLETVANVETKDFLKFVDLKIVESAIPLERIEDFFVLNNYLKLYDLVVLVNPQAYFSNKEIVEIYRFALYNETKLVVLESRIPSKKLEYEKIISIDEDLFDIYI